MQILHVYQLKLSLLVLHVVWRCQNCNEFDTVYVCGCVVCACVWQRVWLRGICTTKTLHRHDLKLDTVVVLDIVSQPTDFWVHNG